MLKLAVQILDSKKGHFDPSKFEDRYETALMELIKAKRAGKKPPAVSEAKPSNVINLMDALRKSARGNGGGDSRRSTSARKSSGRKSGKRAAPKRKVRKAS
jgi:DNA end-binding protein Ku